MTYETRPDWARPFTSEVWEHFNEIDSLDSVLDIIVQGNEFGCRKCVLANKQLNLSTPIDSGSRIKRYCVFAGGSFYPLGGWKDYQGSRDTPETAIELLEELLGGRCEGSDGSPLEWGNIVDITTGLFLPGYSHGGLYDDGSLIPCLEKYEE